jgi:DNA-binding LytR/AlgR family response regulator
MTAAVIADDEPLLRAQLRSRLARLWPELRVVHEMENGRGVDDVLARFSPRVFFLDIHMPGANGLEAARAIGKRAHVVFVTAYEQYAIEAFERGAVDYVLKPFTEERLALTIGRVKERVGGSPPDLDALVQSLAARLQPAAGPSYLRWIKASVGSNVRLIPVEEVLFFQSDEKYTRVVTCEGETLIRKPIRELLDVLDPARFKQIHRSTIVNTKAIAAITRDESGRGTIRLRNRAETLPVSLTFMPVFKGM